MSSFSCSNFLVNSDFLLMSTWSSMDLVKDVESLIEVINEQQLLICLLENVHSCHELIDHFLDLWLLVIRKHQLENVICSRSRVVNLLNGRSVHSCGLHPHVVVSWTSLQIKYLLDGIILSVTSIKLFVAFLLL